MAETVKAWQLPGCPFCGGTLTLTDGGDDSAQDDLDGGTVWVACEAEDCGWCSPRLDSMLAALRWALRRPPPVDARRETRSLPGLKDLQVHFNAALPKGCVYATDWRSVLDAVPLLGDVQALAQALRAAWEERDRMREALEAIAEVDPRDAASEALYLARRATGEGATPNPAGAPREGEE